MAPSSFPFILCNDSQSIDSIFLLTHSLVFIWSLGFLFAIIHTLALRVAPLENGLVFPWKSICTISISSILVHNHNSNLLSLFKFQAARRQINNISSISYIPTLYFNFKIISNPSQFPFLFSFYYHYHFPFILNYEIRSFLGKLYRIASHRSPEQ